MVESTKGIHFLINESKKRGGEGERGALKEGGRQVTFGGKRGGNPYVSKEGGKREDAESSFWGPSFLVEKKVATHGGPSLFSKVGGVFARGGGGGGGGLGGGGGGGVIQSKKIPQYRGRRKEKGRNDRESLQ